MTLKVRIAPMETTAFYFSFCFKKNGSVKWSSEKININIQFNTPKCKFDFINQESNDDTISSVFY